MVCNMEFWGCKRDQDLGNLRDIFGVIRRLFTGDLGIFFLKDSECLL